MGEGCRCDDYVVACGTVSLWQQPVVPWSRPSDSPPPPPPPPPCLMYTLKRIYIYAEFLTIIHVLISYLIGSEAKWPACRSRRHCLNQCWHSSSTHIYVSRRDWIEYYATLWSWWSYTHRNGYVVVVAGRVVTGGAEACLQRLQASAPPVMAGAVILATYPCHWWNRHAFLFILYSVWTHWGRNKMAAFLQTTF